MPFCMNCGKNLPDGAKFCDGCGTALGQTSTKSERTVEYEGTIHKCPNCGDIIDAYESVCEACGYEIRDRKASNSIRELAVQIQEIEKTRGKARNNPLKTLYFGQSTTETDKKIISLISNFPIPNSKEDLYEFIILSRSNINVDVYDTGGNQFKENDARLAISNAWKAKLEQAYQKAKLVFVGDPRFADIQSMYDSVHVSIKKAKWKTWKFVGLIYAILIGFLAIVFAIVFISLSAGEKKEVARLESIVEQIEVALDEGDYKYALLNADSLEFTKSDADLQKEWQKKREYYIDKVIEEASENGVTLERPVEIENEVNSSSPQFDEDGNIKIGYSQYDFKYKNFLEVKQELENQGFTNVKTEGLKDLSVDWMSQDGSIEKVTIDGETGYTSDIAYPPDVEIIIYHHSYKDN